MPFRNANEQLVEANRGLREANALLVQSNEGLVQANRMLVAENARKDQVVHDASERYKVLARQIEAEVEKKFDELVTRYLANEAVIRDLQTRNQELEALVASLQGPSGGV